MTYWSVVSGSGPITHVGPARPGSCSGRRTVPNDVGKCWSDPLFPARGEATFVAGRIVRGEGGAGQRGAGA